MTTLGPHARFHAAVLNNNFAAAAEAGGQCSVQNFVGALTTDEPIGMLYLAGEYEVIRQIAHLIGLGACIVRARAVPPNSDTCQGLKEFLLAMRCVDEGG